MPAVKSYAIPVDKVQQYFQGFVKHLQVHQANLVNKDGSIQGVTFSNQYPHPNFQNALHIDMHLNNTQIDQLFTQYLTALQAGAEHTAKKAQANTIPGWKFLGAGSFNNAYVSDDGREVLKIQKRATDATDTPERSVRLWNQINSHVPPPARLLQTTEGSGWVCPFIQGVQASDSEMAVALLDIYNKTGRIIVDATAVKNFVKTPSGQVLCVDVGMAMQLERREEKKFSQLARRHSVVSLDTWKNSQDNYTPFFAQCSKTNPQTVNMVKALVFIKDNRPDIFDVNFLKTNPDLINKLAKAYDAQSTQLVLDGFEALEQLDTLKRLDSTSYATVSAPPPSEIKSYPIPLEKKNREYLAFCDYVAANQPQFINANGYIEGVDFSDPYPNPDDEDELYTNMSIDDPQVDALFVQYLEAQLAKAQQEVAEYASSLENDRDLQVEETLVDEASTTESVAIEQKRSELIVGYEQILGELRGVDFECKCDKTITPAEKNLFDKFSNNLKTEIIQGIEKIQTSPSPEKETQQIDTKLKEHVQDITAHAVKIPCTKGFKGLINKICDAFGFSQPFKTYSSEVKAQLQQIKNTATKENKEEISLNSGPKPNF